MTRQPAPGPGPGHPRTYVPEPLSEEDRRELWEPDSDLFPEEYDYQALRRAKFLIVVDQIHGTGRPPSLAELLDTITARTRQPEPDLEAEP